MGTTPSPFDAAIEELERNIRQLQGALDTLRSLRAAPSDGSLPIPPLATSRDSDTEIRHDTFFGMTIADAARKYLTMVKQTKSTADIAEALERGGLKHASKDFSMTVRAVISPREEFVRVNSDWGLTEWYPGMRKDKKQPRAAEKQKAGKSTKAMSKKRPIPLVPTRKDRVLKAMSSQPDKNWTSAEIAKILDDVKTSVQSVMTALAKSGELVKGDVGYHLPKTKTV